MKLSPSEIWSLYRKVSMADVGVFGAGMLMAAAVLYLLFGVAIIYF